MHRLVYLLSLLAIAATATAGCGSGDSSSGAASTTRAGSGKPKEQTPADRTPGYTQIYRADSAALGRILFNEYGFTLYRFYKDKEGIPSCYGPCAKEWPPYLAEGEFRARKEKVLHHMGRVERKDGTVQVTYFGHPLYTYVGDLQTGDTDGNELHAFGGQWYALHPNGHKAQGGAGS